MCGSVSYANTWLVPMSRGSGREWLPTFGVLWQVVHVPATEGRPSTSFSPRTLVIVSTWVLKICSPRAIACRDGVSFPLFVSDSQCWKIDIDAGSNAADRKSVV